VKFRRRQTRIQEEPIVIEGKTAAGSGSNFVAKRRGLVLAGGGAKGAYSFGCLKAFKEHGIEFDAVAGTSVGALNAVVWASGKLSEGEKLWRNISFENVYPVSFVPSRKYNEYFVKAMAACYVVLRLTWASVQGLPVPFRVLWLAFAALATVIPLWVTAAPHLFWPNGLDIPFLMFQLTFYLYPMTFLLLLNRRTVNQAFVLLMLYLGWTAALAFIFPTNDPFVFLSLFGGYGLLLASRRVPGRVFADKTALLSQSPLAKTLAEILSTGLRIPTVVTMAREVGIFDPDNPKWTSKVQALVVGDQVIFSEPANSMHYPDLRMDWVPSYVDIQKLAPDLAARLCLASAALPFGIVPPIEIDGITYCDGGVVDNCPVFPILNTGLLDEIYVLLLEPCKSEERMKRAIGVDVQNWSDRDRQLRLAAFARPAAVHTRLSGGDKYPYEKRNKVPTVLPYRYPCSLPSVVLFYPKKSLGGFLDGTLRFDRDYASRLVDRGYEDALEIISAERMKPPPKPRFRQPWNLTAR
jgi:predicted acylesterase/phospholipase RssA